MDNMSGKLRNRRQAPSEAPSLVEEEPAKSSDNSADQDESAYHVRIRPLIERRVWARLDVLPFAFAYAMAVALDTQTGLSTVLWIALLVSHLSIVLAAQWNLGVRAWIGYVTAQSALSATHALVEDEDERPGIAVVVHESATTVVCRFHDRQYRFSTEPLTLFGASEPLTAGLAPLPFPAHRLLEFYRQWSGHANMAAVVEASRIYGPNRTLLVLPGFGHLLAEQVTAPFFLFQVFCVVLWCLDEYWIYAIYTLGALLLFESVLAYNRLQSMQRLHDAGQHGRARVWVRRGQASGPPGWMVISTGELVPGDVVSLKAMTVPADIVLISGTAVADEALLTGESIPQLKHALDTSGKIDGVRLDLVQHKESILFGGTVLVSTMVEDGTPKESTPPDDGVTGIVLRTGFETAQGSLLRTMAHSAKSKDGVHNLDTFIFILILLVCALAAAGWVWMEGWYDPKRNRFRLMLHVILIVTSVVPPELPMELSLAVTNSVADLMKRYKVYCTEHYRIPLAGQVNVCCFDKTGTLTSDEMRLRGVRLIGNYQDEEDALLLPEENDIPWETIRIMAGCHSLATTSNAGRRGQALSTIVGDPLEQAVLKRTGYRLMRSNVVAPEASPDGKTITVLHRFAFSSKLKRMTVLVAEEGSQGTILALTKGAPETIKEFLTAESIPSDYDGITYHHMSRGRRVLAMAWRELGQAKHLAKYKDSGRDSIEKGLTFAGFLVLDCPLKPDSKSVISELKKSGHAVVMITGDAILTAVEVARQVGIVKKASGKRKLYRIQSKPKGTETKNGSSLLPGFELVEMTANGSEAQRADLSNLAHLADGRNVSFCMTGDVLVSMALAILHRDGMLRISTQDEKHMLLSTSVQSVLADLVPFVSVFARHAPHQKEAVVAALNRSGRHTLMCGDGTNDVGALKRASVGISIVSAPGVESKQRKAAEDIHQAKQETGTKSGKNPSIEDSMRQLREAQHELDHVELGDASVAAPFTSRAVSIKCCSQVVQQGRCTLVTMLSIYKILGVNCLVNALVLSKLFLHGVKQGDRQMTSLGFVVAALFYFVTRAEPLPVLASVRPPSSVLCAPALLSITGQFVIHSATILLATDIALNFVDPYDPSMVPDGPFNPNVLNSCAFLLTCLATINTFAVNYPGRPFMADLRENKMLYRSLQVCYTILFVSSLEAFPPLNDLLQLTALPKVQETDFLVSANPLLPLIRTVDFPIFLCGLMIVNTVLTFSSERLITSYFKQK